MDTKVGIDYIVVNVYIDRSTGGPMPTPTRYHHGDLRAALIARATQVVAAGGVDALSLRELARDLGVSHGAPSRHFPDRRSLLDALARSGFERLRADLLVAMAGSSGSEQAGFTAELTAVAAAYVRFAVGNPSLLAIMFAAKHDTAAPPDLRAAADLAFAAPTEAIRAAQARGEVIPGDVEDIGFTILAVMHGFASLQAGGLMEPDHTGALLATTVQRLVEGLAPRPAVSAASSPIKGT